MSRSWSVSFTSSSHPIICALDFPWGSAGKESACNAGDLGSIPGMERSPGGGKGYQLQFSGLENSMGYSAWGCKESDTTEQLSRHFTSSVHIFMFLSQVTVIPGVLRQSLTTLNPLLLESSCCSVTKSCLTLCNPMDCSSTGSSVQGISQVRTWNGLPFPSPGNLPEPGMEPMSSALVGGFFTAELPGKPLEPSTNLCDATWRGQVWCFCQEEASSSAHLGELLKQGDLSPIFSQLRFPLHNGDPGKGGVKHLVQWQKWWQISHWGANQMELRTWRTNSVKERKQKIKGGGRNGGRGRQGGREEWGREEKEESKMLLLLPLHPVKGKGEKIYPSECRVPKTSKER